MRRTKKEALETREAILDAAELSFLEKGVSQTSLDMVAKRASVSRGAIYFHFVDKLAIYHAIVDRVRFPQEQIIDQVLAHDGVNPIDILENSAISCLDKFINDEKQQRVLTIIMMRCEYVGEFSETIMRLREAHNGMLSLFERMFSIAKKRGMLCDDWTEKEASRILVAVLSGALNEWLFTGKNFDLKKLGTKMIKAQTQLFRKKSLL